MTTHDTPHNKALELADRIANDENEHLPVSRSEIATLLRSQASDLAEARAEIEKLRAAGQMALEALDSVAGKGKLCNTAITALTTALKGTP